MNDSIIITRRLGDILELQRGYDLPTSKRIDGEVPIISSSGYSGCHNEYKCEGENVVTGRYGTIGEVYYHSGKCWPLNTALFVKDFKGNIPKYVYYLLKNALSVYRVSGNDKSAVPGVDRKVIHEMPVPFHEDISSQQNVCDVLTCIDDKIDINSQICLSLESIAKTLYDYWFVQFDFPDENGRPYRASGGEMVWNEQLKRKIPKGWTAKSLSNICKFRNGINYKKGCLGDYTYRIANVRNITASSFLMDVNDFDEIILPKEQGNRYVLNENDIIIARSGTPGATRLVIDPSNNVIFCGFIICCTPSNPKHKLYLTHFLKQLEGTNATKTGGSILQNVSQDTLKSLQVALPNDFVLDRFNKKIESLVQMMQNIIDENRELIQLRDWLLPMLMNGQTRVE